MTSSTPFTDVTVKKNLAPSQNQNMRSVLLNASRCYWTFATHKSTFTQLLFQNREYMLRSVHSEREYKTQQTEMEAHKRKQQADADVVSRRQKLKKARADKRDETAVTEDEVEEFFAILRRIHVAVTHFRNANGGGTKYMDGGLRAVLESSEEEDGDTKKDEDVGWDLNADPKPECDLS